MKLETEFLYAGEFDVLVRAKAKWVDAYDAGGLTLEFLDPNSEEPIAMSLTRDVYEDIEFLAIEELKNFQDESGVEFTG